MADIDSGNKGDTNPYPLDMIADPLNPIPIPRIPVPRISIPSVNNPIRFTNDDDNSDDEDKKPSYQGHSLPEIAMMKLQKVKALEYNDANPYIQRQAIVYQLIPYTLEWLLDSDIPRLDKSNPVYKRQKYWSRLVVSQIYGQIDTIL